MQSVIPPGDPERTTVAGKDQGFLGLAINYGVTFDTNHQREFPTMVTAWEPTAQDLAALNAGANIIVQLLGTPPINPMCVFVGETPVDRPAKKPVFDAAMITKCVRAMSSHAKLTTKRGMEARADLVRVILETAGMEAAPPPL